jgi:hypothetical protein
LRGRGDPILVRDRPKIDLEGAVGPDQRAINRFLPAQPAELRIDHLAFTEVNPPFTPLGLNA